MITSYHFAIDLLEGIVFLVLSGTGFVVIAFALMVTFPKKGIKLKSKRK